MSAKYSAIAAKLKAMYASSLSEQDFMSLTEKKSVSEICRFLKATDAYGSALEGIDESNAHRGAMEYLMREKLFDDYVKIFRFMDNTDSDVIRFYFIRREIEFLKDEIHYIYTNEERRGDRWSDEEFDSYFEKTHSKINRDIIKHASSLEDCLEACRGTIYEEPLERAINLNSDFFMLGMILDEYYYRNLWKTIHSKLPKGESAGFEKIIGSSADMMNMMWIYRGKKYFKFANEMIFAYLLPVRYRLSADNIRAMVNSNSEAEFLAAVSGTPYAELFEGLDDGLFVEENFVYMMYRISKGVFRSASLASIIAYTKLKDWEIWRITTVIEGVRYGKNPELIQKHIRTGERGVV